MNASRRKRVRIDRIDDAAVEAFKDYNWSKWSDWMPLTALNPEAIPATPGAYVLATTRTVTRAIGADSLGILHIGEAGRGSATVRGRIERMHWCMTERGVQGHMAGWRFAYFRFERRFPLNTLQVRWIGTRTKKTAYEHEGRIMLTYLLRHCELPPLNYKFNWSAFEEIGWDVFDAWIMNCAVEKENA